MNQQIFGEIQTLKRQILPNEKVILFGSQARGDAREDSDWDLLVLLNKSKKNIDDYPKYRHPFLELGWSLGQYFSTKVFTFSEWEKQKPSFFYKNVEQEGIEII
jgi:predicted nucleotidyltransferase